MLSACAGTPNATPVIVAITTGGDDRLQREIAAALTSTANPQTATPNAADNRSTLPPSWTPTFTPTPAPPTATITPTLTPTVTQTLSAEAICDTFYVNSNLRPGEIFAWDSQVTLYVDSVPSDVTVRFLAVHHFSGDNRGADLPGGQSNILQLPVKNLPQTGQYDWTLVIRSESYGDICAQDGWFIAAGRNSTRAEEDRIR